MEANRCTGRDVGCKACGREKARANRSAID